MSDVMLPLLAAPFMGAASLRLGAPVAAAWRGARLATDGDQLCVQGDADALLAAFATRLVFTAPAAMIGRREPKMRATISDDGWAQLSIFANRTLAPASEESRSRGAGAGLSDND